MVGSSLEEQSTEVRMAMWQVELALGRLKRTGEVLGECRNFPGKAKLVKAVDAYRGVIAAGMHETAPRVYEAMSPWGKRPPGEVTKDRQWQRPEYTKLAGPEPIRATRPEPLEVRPSWDVNLDWGDELNHESSEEDEAFDQEDEAFEQLVADVIEEAKTFLAMMRAEKNKVGMRPVGMRPFEDGEVVG